MLVCLSPNGQNRFDGATAPDRLLVATAQGVSLLERNGGAWRNAGTYLETMHSTTLTTLPGRAGVLVGTHGDGVLFSEDGTRWEPRNDGLAIRDVYSVAARARDGGIRLYAGTQPAALFESRDLGRHWTELPAMRQVPDTEAWTFPAPPRIAHTKMIVFDPRDADTIYLAVEQGAFLKTRDGGKIWREYSGYSRADDRAYRDVHQIMLVPSNPEIVYMTTGVGLYKSPDGGATWERLTGAEFRLAYPDHMALSPDEKTLFMSGARTDPGVWRRNHVADSVVVRSRDGGKTWDTDPHGLDFAPRNNIEAMSLASYPGGYTVFVGDTEGAVHATEDGGESWVKIADALGPVTKGDHAALLRQDLRHAPAHA